MRTFLQKLKSSPVIVKVLLAIAVIIAFVFSLISYSKWITLKEVPNIENEINSFLTSISHEDYKNAYQLYSNKYRQEEDYKTFKESTIQIRPLSKNYKSGSLETLEVFTRYYFSAPSELHYRGQIEYTDTNQIGEIDAIYILENEKWKLYGLQIFPPITKFKNISPVPKSFKN
jgi:hypothetical protein